MVHGRVALQVQEQVIGEANLPGLLLQQRRQGSHLRGAGRRPRGQPQDTRPAGGLYPLLCQGSPSVPLKPLSAPLGRRRLYSVFRDKCTYDVHRTQHSRLHERHTDHEERCSPTATGNTPAAGEAPLRRPSRHPSTNARPRLRDSADAWQYRVLSPGSEACDPTVSTPCSLPGGVGGSSKDVQMADRRTRRCSASLMIGDGPIRTLRSHLPAPSTAPLRSGKSQVVARTWGTGAPYMPLERAVPAPCPGPSLPRAVGGPLPTFATESPPPTPLLIHSQEK